MQVVVSSYISNKRKFVENRVALSTLKDVDFLLKMVVTDSSAFITRPDGLSKKIVVSGLILLEITNGKQELLDWANE